MNEIHQSKVDLVTGYRYIAPIDNAGRGRKMDGGQSKRKYPGYTLMQLESSVAEGRGNAIMEQEIKDRKAGATGLLVPQIEGGKPQTKVGRL